MTAETPAETPAEPPPPPRPFPLRRLGFGALFWLLFGGIWFAVGATLTVVFTLAGGPVWHDWILDARGEVAQATPVAVEDTNSHMNSRQVFEIVFRFGPSGEFQGRTSTTDSELLDRAKAGQTLAIDYDPQDPALSRVRGQRASLFGLFVLIPALFALVGGIILLIGVAKLLVRRRLYVHGQAVLAQVLSVNPTNTRINNRPLMRVGYAYQGSLGPCQGSDALATPPAAGARIWVLFDPEQPERSVIA